MAQQEVKLQRPKGRDLREIYRGICSASEGVRMAALAEAAQWYDGAVDYLVNRRGKFDEEGQKLLLLAVKTRNLGISTNHPGEKETALRKALQFYERVCRRLKPPSVEEQYKRYEQRRGRLESRQSKLTAKFSLVTRTLVEALRPVTAEGRPVTVLVGESGSEARQYDPSLSQLTYSRAAARALQRRAREVGLLPVLFDELRTVSRAASLQADGHGGYANSEGLQVIAVFQMLGHLVEWLRGPEAPRNLVKRGGREVSAAGPDLPQRAQRKPGPRGGPKVGGMYEAGSAMAYLYETLSDGQWHKKTDLQAKISAELGGRMVRLKKEGRVTGRWAIEENREQARMNVVQ